MSKVVCPGSFDPVTLGHLDIINRAADVFDRVIVLVMANPEKKNAFTAQERADMISLVTRGCSNVSVDIYQGLLADYLKQNKIDAIVKGLRCSADYEYEYQMAVSNRVLVPSCDTLFLSSGPEHYHMSSTIVRQIASLGGDFSSFVPPEIFDAVKQRFLR